MKIFDKTPDDKYSKNKIEHIEEIILENLNSQEASMLVSNLVRRNLITCDTARVVVDEFVKTFQENK
jgi:hypothetical protein